LDISEVIMPPDVIDLEKRRRPGPATVEQEERAAIQTDGRKWISLADRASRLGGRGMRIPLGIKTLDEACRGGLLPGKILIVGGAPGAGKTTFVTQKAHELAKRGIHVAVLAADEDAEGLLIRIGQNENLCREDLEDGSDAARAELVQRVRELPLMLVDAEDEGGTVEAVAEELAKRAAKAPSVLIVDSVQTCRAIGMDIVDNPRARADLVMVALKRMARQFGHVVVATSEVSRGWYRNSNERIDPLAAFKESGGIEYGAAVAVAMVNVKGEDDLVDVVVAKNRLGRKDPFRLKLSFVSARFNEVEPSDEKDETPARRFENLTQQILRLLRKRTDLRSKNGVFRELGGHRREVLDALDELIATGEIAIVEGFFRARPPAWVDRDER
jgi:replicative DNA helicase